MDAAIGARFHSIEPEEAESAPSAYDNDRISPRGCRAIRVKWQAVVLPVAFQSLSSLPLDLEVLQQIARLGDLPEALSHIN